MHAHFCCKFHVKQEETMKVSINQLADTLTCIKCRDNSVATVMGYGLESRGEIFSTLWRPDVLECPRSHVFNGF
jgi:hypothetical protein